MSHYKQVPYGVADFERVIKQNFYYVDKTMYLPKLEEQPSNLFFIRPRRFGKSLFLNMLRAYYDCKRKEEFQMLFGKLWIGQHPTPLQGKYLILSLDFSQVGGTIEQVETKFNNYCNIMLDSFVDKYKECFPEGFAEKVHHVDSTDAKLTTITNEAQRCNLPLYLIIDEYDNFTNPI